MAQDLQTLLAVFLRDLYAGTVTFTGTKVLGADGSISLPTYAFTSEPSLGFYRFSSGIIAATGALSVTGTLTAAGVLSMAGLTTSGEIRSQRAILGMAPGTTGQVNLTNESRSVGVGWDVATDAIFKIRTRAQTGDAAITASLYGSSTVSTLTITTNTIAPTSLIHQLGAGLVKTITVPATMGATGFVMLHPTAAFTYDATGNILVPSGGGTAVIDKVMVLTWNGTKWVPSY